MAHFLQNMEDAGVVVRDQSKRATVVIDGGARVVNLDGPVSDRVAVLYFPQDFEIGRRNLYATVGKSMPPVAEWQSLIPNNRQWRVFIRPGKLTVNDATGVAFWDKKEDGHYIVFAVTNLNTARRVYVLHAFWSSKKDYPDAERSWNMVTDELINARVARNVPVEEIFFRLYTEVTYDDVMALLL